MAYVYNDEDEQENGGFYRGGATGVENDFDLRAYFAQQAAQALQANANRATADQIATAKNDLGGARAAYEYLAANGMYSDAEMGALESAAVQNINRTTRAMQQNVNNTIAQRGQAANAGISAALSLPGQFAAAGERGKTRADLIQKNKDSQLAGLEGYTDLSKAVATLSATPTQQTVDTGQYMNLYDQWRNADVGYDGAKWATSSDVEQPDYYDDEVESSTSTKKRKRSGGGTGFAYGG